MKAKQIQDYTFEPTDLEFDIEEGGVLISLQNLAEKRQVLLLRGTLRNFESAESCIVANHRMQVG